MPIFHVKGRATVVLTISKEEYVDFDDEIEANTEDEAQQAALDNLVEETARGEFDTVIDSDGDWDDLGVEEVHQSDYALSRNEALEAYRAMKRAGVPSLFDMVAG